MKEVLTYIAGVVACSGLFVLFYRLVLHRHGGEGSFRTARIFLPASLVASVVIPALKIPVWPSAPVEIPFIMQALPMAETPFPATAPTVDVLQVVLWVLYGIGIAVLTGVMVWQAAKIARIRRRAEIHNMERCTVAVSDEVSAPFSFLATVYIGRETSPDEMRQIVLHEGSHIRHRHSVEKIIMETLKALLWFNPFAWWASRLLVEVHEFEADRDVLRGGYTVEEYLPVIFRQIFGYVPEISTGLGNSLTKKRLLMMRKTMKQSRLGWLRAAGVLPLAAGMMTLFSFTDRAPEIIMTGTPEIVEQAPEPEAAKVEAVAEPAEKPAMKDVEVIGYGAQRKGDGDTPAISLGHRVENETGQPLFWLANEEREMTDEEFKNLDPNTIQQIDVLKGATAVNFYGEAAKNGVVVITLKGEGDTSDRGRDEWQGEVARGGSYENILGDV